MADVNVINKLRETTGAGVMEAKKALDEAQGDYDRAIAILQERGQAKVEKRAGRETGAGLVKTYVHNGRIGVLLEVRAETDFVVRSEPFQNMAQDLVMQIAAMNPENVEELLASPYIKDPSKTVNDLVKDVIARVGENVQVTKFFRVEV
jgi:elongation factor Ts